MMNSCSSVYVLPFYKEKVIYIIPRNAGGEVLETVITTAHKSHLEEC